ncbi:MAG: DUF6492 family protein [Beijerinckiaceae bacterium]
MAGKIAVVTPSYAGDLERCRLLCESMDIWATEPIEHLILIADHDLPLFKPFNTANRRVVPDSAILPRWLKALKPPFGRWRWISREPARLVWPMTGWHVQQIRKLLAARLTDADVLVMADSDSVFVRPLSPELFVSAGKVRLYARPDGILAKGPIHQLHRQWTSDAARLLRLPEPGLPATDFINNLVSWRRNSVLSMLAWIESIEARDIAEVLGRHRTFSEYQLYGAYATLVDDQALHAPDARSLSHTYWSGEALTSGRLDAFIDGMDAQQIAICIQSFTETSVEAIRDKLRTLRA